MTKIITQDSYVHIRENCDFWIGTSQNPTHLIVEVLDNSVDELFSGRADTIIVKITGSQVTIFDNGEGVPNENDEVIRICTTLLTSGKFNSNKKSNNYRFKIGRHGVGLKAVNALSTNLVVTSIRKGNKKTYLFKNGKHIKTDVQKTTKPSMSQISFIPDGKIFETLDYDINYIHERLTLIKMQNPKAKIALIVNDKNILIKEIGKLQYFMNKVNTPLFNESALVRLESKNKCGEYFEMFLYINKNKVNSEFNGVVNLLPINRGEHLTFLKSIIYEAVKSEFKGINKKDVMVFQDILGIFLIEDAKFGGQDKDKLTVSQKVFSEKFNKEAIISKLRKKLETQLIVVRKKEISLLRYFQNLVNKRILKKSIKTDDIDKTTGKGSIKLKACKNKSGCTLFITEGDSASGNLVDIRDSSIHAIYPISGKILNVEKSNLTRIIKNSVVMGLIKTIGMYELNKSNGCFELMEKKPKYSQIVIVVDPDVDGKHIAILLIKLFKTLMPEVINRKMLYFAKTPLYGGIKMVKNKRHFVPIHKISDYNKCKKNGYSLIRHKGLGEFNAEDLEIVLFKNKEWVLLSNDNSEISESLFGLANLEE